MKKAKEETIEESLMNNPPKNDALEKRTTIDKSKFVPATLPSDDEILDGLIKNLWSKASSSKNESK